MKLCDFCGFVVGASDLQCKNCLSPMPGMEQQVSQLDANKTVTKVPTRSVGEDYSGFSRFLPKFGNLSGLVPKKTIVLLLVIGIIAAPQTQSLVSEGIDYLGEMNTPYYNFPESISLKFVRNFTVYLESGKSAEYELILSKPGDRPIYPQQDDVVWQTVSQIEVLPEYMETNESRMKWSGNLNGTERSYIHLEYDVTINTIRPELGTADSGSLDDIPTGYETYLDDDWLITPSSEVIQKLAEQMVEGTEGNVVQILTNIYKYISSNYRYQASSIPKSCDETMSKLEGDCDDFSILFSSIARAAGIPTWIELGKIPAFIDASSECDLRDWGGHAWINSLVPLKDGTHMVVFIDLANSYFMWMPPYRISDWVDDGDGDNLDSYYHLFTSSGTGVATYKENSYVAECSASGNLKLTEL